MMNDERRTKGTMKDEEQVPDECGKSVNLPIIKELG